MADYSKFANSLDALLDALFSLEPGDIKYCPAGVSDFEVFEYQFLSQHLDAAGIHEIYPNKTDAERLSFVGGHIPSCEQCKSVYAEAEKLDRFKPAQKLVDAANPQKLQ